MTNKTILEGRFSLSGKDKENKFPIRTVYKWVNGKQTNEVLYYERFSTISVARTSGDNPNWDNVPVIIKSTDGESKLKGLELLEGKTVKCQGSIRTSYDSKKNVSYFNVVTGSVDEVTEAEKEERRRKAQQAKEPQFN